MNRIPATVTPETIFAPHRRSPIGRSDDTSETIRHRGRSRRCRCATVASTARVLDLIQLVREPRMRFSWDGIDVARILTRHHDGPESLAGAPLAPEGEVAHDAD